jgi:hypothetical protein
LSAAADGVEATSSSTGMPSMATAFFTCAMGSKRLRVSSAPRAARDAPLVAFTCCVFSVAWEFLVFSYVFGVGSVHNVVLPFAVSWVL